MLCLLTPHYTHSPLSHFFEGGTANASCSFSQEWLTFRKTERKKQMGRRGVRQRDILHADKWIIGLNEGLTAQLKKKRKTTQEVEETNAEWPGPSRVSATNEIKELLTRPPLWDSALTHRMIAPLWLLIDFQSATDHIIMVTDGITKVTDHFVMETLIEKKSRRRTRYFFPCKMCVCVCPFSG